jgi:membrane-associated protease RseP (regulator of RpoE activity)
MDKDAAEYRFPVRRKPSFFDKDRPWLNALLFVLTFVSAFFVGMTWSLSYQYADSLHAPESLSLGWEAFTDPVILWMSFLYAFVLLLILLGHEMGHYLACRRYGINATLPFFIPAPTLIGTLGAFIKIRSPITRKHHLFDIGVAGPLTGFILAVPAVFYGLAFSKPVPPLPQTESLAFGEPLLIKLFGAFLLNDIPPGYDIVVHPIAFAGWVGILVTALNLCPVGQLDGGHVMFSVLGKNAKKLGRIILAAFVVFGVFFWIGWFVWALLISVLGLRHPPVLDQEVPLSRGRIILSGITIMIFILSFIPAPILGYSLMDLLKPFIS